MSRKQVAAIVGVAPYDFDSGKMKGMRRIWSGRALSGECSTWRPLTACRFNPALKTFHERLAAAGKKSKVVIVAVMRKIITTLNAIIRDMSQHSCSFDHLVGAGKERGRDHEAEGSGVQA
jgi:transposase